MSIGWFGVKITPNDRLYSEIIRWGKSRCERCDKVRKLQCAHIMGRGAWSTRFMLMPVRNAIALCFTCHHWFDHHKMHDLITEPTLRVFKSNQESFTFLVKKLGYTWEQLSLLLILSHKPGKRSAFMDELTKRELMKELARLRNGRN